MKNFTYDLDADGIALFTFDCPGRSMNVLGESQMEDITAIVEKITNDDDIKGAVFTSGKKAFCAGGDIAELYEHGTKGDYAYGRKFWADEYRLNNKIFSYPKPVISFLQGFTMGGGVGIGCHGSHRIVGESSQIAMPECGIGLVPDVGGTLMLALAPGRLGEYLGITASRMGADDAIYCGFADSYIPQIKWITLIEELEKRLENGEVVNLDKEE